MSEQIPATETVDVPVVQKRGRIAPFVAAALVVVLIGFGWVLVGADPPGSDGESAESPLIGKPAPEVVSTTFDGSTFDLARRRGSWVVLNFFNSTCVPCIKEHPELIEFEAQQEAVGADGAELYTIVFDDSDGPVREFFDENGGDWPIIRDENGTITTNFGMSQVPETWVIAPSGVVVARYIGQIEADQLSATIQRFRDQVG